MSEHLYASPNSSCSGGPEHMYYTDPITTQPLSNILLQNNLNDNNSTTSGSTNTTNTTTTTDMYFNNLTNSMQPISSSMTSTSISMNKSIQQLPLQQQQISMNMMTSTPLYQPNEVYPVLNNSIPSDISINNNNNSNNHQQQQHKLNQEAYIALLEKKLDESKHLQTEYYYRIEQLMALVEKQTLRISELQDQLQNRQQ